MTDDKGQAAIVLLTDLINCRRDFRSTRISREIFLQRVDKKLNEAQLLLNVKFNSGKHGFYAVQEEKENSIGQLLSHNED